MTQQKLSRRGLFSFLRPEKQQREAQAVKPPSPHVAAKPEQGSTTRATGGHFSVEAFYRSREGQETNDTLPVFERRFGLPDPRELNTTVGVPELKEGEDQLVARVSGDEGERNDAT
jgi:hypothetical protein